MAHELTQRLDHMHAILHAQSEAMDTQQQLLFAAYYLLLELLGRHSDSIPAALAAVLAESNTKHEALKKALVDNSNSK